MPITFHSAIQQHTSVDWFPRPAVGVQESRGAPVVNNGGVAELIVSLSDLSAVRTTAEADQASAFGL